MKKITKLCKIFLVLVTVFSNLSSTVKVLADEIISKPLILTLEQVFDEENGCVDKYNLSYISERNDYEEYEEVDGETIEKTYDIKLSSTFTYLNNETTLEKVDVIEDVTGRTLNTVRSTYELDPISKYFDGVFNLVVTVLDDETTIYEREISYNVNNNYKGITSFLNEGEILPYDEVVNYNSIGNFEVSEGKEYTSYFKIMIGELNPTSSYKIVLNDGTMTDSVSALELREEILVGSSIDLTGKLYGDYSDEWEITFVEVSGEDIINTYTYSYSTNIEYDGDNDYLLNTIFSDKNLIFADGYAIMLTPELSDRPILLVGQVLEAIKSYNNDILVEVTDDSGNVLDLTLEENLLSEVKNNYVLKLTNGVDVCYTTVVVGDTDGDNHFTKDDLITAMKGYLEDELILSMDMLGEDEELGVIGFDDVMFFNEILKNSEEQVEDIPLDNQNFSLQFSDITDEIYVGDYFDLSLVVKTDNVADYIDGITGLVSTNSNLKLVDIKFNNKLIGIFNDNGKFIASGDNVTGDDTLVVTLSFMAISEGVGTVSLTGSTSKYLNIKEFEELYKEIEIKRNISTNNNLASLQASVGTFDIPFDSDVTVYTLTVPSDTKTVILSGSLADIYASVEGLVEYELTGDTTTINVTVTAEDGSKKVYTIYVVKEKETVIEPVTYYYSSNNYLQLLEISGYEIDFERNTYEYKISVDSDVTELDIRAVAEDTGSRVEITGNENFKVGENIVTITVTAENGEIREYKLIVDKEAEEKDVLTEIQGESNTAEKVVIIILIILVVLGLLYLIFKKDDEESSTLEEKKEKSKNTAGKKK